jgi:site-specific recombinase XerD
MLRHACGYALANAGHDTRRIQNWLGHPIDAAHDALHAIERCAV